MSKRLHAAAMTVILGLMPTAPVSTAVAADCSGYSLEGIRPGMEAREVWKAMGGKGYERNREAGPLGPVTGVSYRRSESTLYVLFDSEPGGKSVGRTVLVRLRTPERLVDSASVAASLKARFGEPARGVEPLASGLEAGEAVWLDPGCDVLVRARRSPGEWWAPENDAMEVEVQSLAFARAMARLRGEPLDLPEPRAAAAASPPGATPVERSGVVRAGEAPAPGIVPPVRIKGSSSAPAFPQRARSAGIRAKVTLEVRVLRDGTVGDVRVVECTRPKWGFEAAAAAAVKRWRYRPATVNGEPEEQTITVVINFVP